MTEQEAVKVIDGFYYNLLMKRKARELRNKLKEMPIVVRAGFVKIHATKMSQARL